MSTWQDRVNKVIKLKSPSGITFEALWKGNKRTKEKKLGLFSYPKARGTLAQDLDVEGDKYPLTIYFEGPNHDIDAQRFWNACNERGTWEVKHPVRGILTLQLVTVTEDIQPVTGGNITEMDGDWIEVGIDNPAASVAQLEDDVKNQIDNTKAAAADQFANKVKVNKPSLLARLKAGVLKVVGIINAIKSTIAGIMATVAAIRATVMGIITAGVMLVNSLASAVMTLILLPGQIINDTKTRFAYFNQILDTTFREFSKDFKSTYGSGGANTAAVVELVATACVIGMAETLVDAEFGTREEALSYLEQIEDAAMRATNGLDNIQKAYAGNFIDQQYFSQSDSFNDLAELLRRVRELILRRSFDLSAAKRITLRRDRAPIEIALTEGVDFDVFIASNALKGDEILLLPTGREVVVYQ